jgi:hypothetical protein
MSEETGCKSKEELEEDQKEKDTQILFEEGLRAVRELKDAMVDKVIPCGSGIISKTPREKCLWGSFLRATSTMRSVSKLDHPSDFQLILAGMRNMLEVLVDMMLIHFDSIGGLAEQMITWEEAEKARQADITLDYFTRTGKSVPISLQPRVDYARNVGPKVKARLGITTWKSFPGRWTRRGLLEDAREADKHKNLGLEEFFEGEYRKMCSLIHGSSSIFLRDTPPRLYIGMSALAYIHIFDMALNCCELLMVDYMFASLYPAVVDECKRIMRKRTVLIALRRRPELIDEIPDVI